MRAGCPFSKDPDSWRAGQGGPDGGSTFVNLATSDTITRSRRGGIPDEFIAKISNLPGTLSMANTGQPESGGSQFFINVNANTFLDWWDTTSPSKHPVFGKVIEGYEEVALAISTANTDKYDKPRPPIKMIKMSIEGIYGQAAACADTDGRRLQVAAPVATEEGWFKSWQGVIECWWVALPMPTQTQLSGCIGAMGLHLASRFEATLARRGSSSPRAQGAAAAESQCGWVPERLSQLQLPDFPDVGGVHFTLPPLPRLLPSWQQLQWRQSSVAPEIGAASGSSSPESSTTASTSGAVWMPAAGGVIGASVAFALAAIGARGLSRRARAPMPSEPTVTGLQCSR